MKKQDAPAKNTTRKRAKTKKTEENPESMDRTSENAVLKTWEDANIFPLANKKTAATDRAASKANSQHRASQPETYVLREIPTSVDALTHDTLCRKICQDIFIKASLMHGHHITHIPAWETYPFWIEEAVIADAKSKSPIKPSVLRKRCRARHKQELGIQKQKLYQLGIFADWAASQKTLESRQEARLIALISRLRDSAYLHDLPQLSPWCPKCAAPLNETNLLRMPTQVLNNYIKFPFSLGLEEFGVDVSFCIQIQHLWELAGTIELGITSDTTYLLTKNDEEYLLFAAPQFEHYCKNLTKEATQPELVKEIDATELAQYVVAHPIFPSKELNITLIPESVVANIADELTDALKFGVIPLNPAHHQLSYEIAQALEINAIPIFDETGKFTEEAGQLCGLYLFDAEKFIVPQLEKYEYILKTNNDEIHESHCPRCEEFAVFRPCSTWVFSISENRDTANSLKAQEYWDNYGETEHKHIGDIRNIVHNFRDLQVSTQRQWGMPLPILLCDQCDEPLTDKNALTAIRNSIQRSFEFWFGLSIEELLPADTRCSNCNSSDFRKEATLIDSHFANLLQIIDNSDFKKPPGGHTSVMFVPHTKVDDYEWTKWLAETSVISAALSRSRPIKESQPFKQLKLKTLPPINSNLQIEDAFLNKYPADVVRLVAITPNSNTKQMKSERLEELAKNYLTQYQQLHELFDQVSSYLYPLLLDSQSETHKDGQHFADIDEPIETSVASAPTHTNPEASEIENTGDTTTDKALPIDTLAIIVTEQLLQEIQQAYRAENFYEMWELLTNFCQDDLHFYLQTLQSRSTKSLQAAQMTLSQITTTLLQRLAPLTPFLAEHFYQRTSIDGVNGNHSIFQRNWHDLSTLIANSSMPSNMKNDNAKAEWEARKSEHDPST